MALMLKVQLSREPCIRVSLTLYAPPFSVCSVWKSKAGPKAPKRSRRPKRVKIPMAVRRLPQGFVPLAHKHASLGLAVAQPIGPLHLRGLIAFCLCAALILSSSLVLPLWGSGNKLTHEMNHAMLWSVYFSLTGWVRLCDAWFGFEVVEIQNGLQSPIYSEICGWMSWDAVIGPKSFEQSFTKLIQVQFSNGALNSPIKLRTFRKAIPCLSSLLP